MRISINPALYRNLFVVVAIASGLFACHTTVTPKTARIAKNDTYVVELTSMDRPISTDLTGGSLLLTARFRRLPEKSQIVEAFVVRGYKEACSGGVETKAMESANGHHWIGPYNSPSPNQEVRFDFPTSAFEHIVSGPTRLDILMRDDIGVYQCIELPLVQNKPGYEWEQVQTWTLAWGVSVDTYLKHVEGLEAAAGFLLRIGKRFSPVQLTLDAGAGGAQCNTKTCAEVGSKEDATINPAPMVSLALGAMLDIGQVSIVAFGIGARYRLAVISSATSEGTKQIWIQGPALVPMISLVQPDPLVPGVPGGPTLGYLVGLALPLGFVATASGATTFTFGSELVVQIPLI
jgi:hypothetical protein